MTWFSILLQEIKIKNKEWNKKCRHINTKEMQNLWENRMPLLWVPLKHNIPRKWWLNELRLQLTNLLDRCRIRLDFGKRTRQELVQMNTSDIVISTSRVRMSSSGVLTSISIHPNKRLRFVNFRAKAWSQEAFEQMYELNIKPRPLVDCCGNFFIHTKKN